MQVVLKGQLHAPFINGDAFCEDNRNVWSLLVQYIGETIKAKPITDRYSRSKNGQKCWKDLVVHYESESYKQNCVTEAEATIQNAHYSGDTNNFSFQTYYASLSTAFNNLQEAGPSYERRATENSCI